MHKTTKSMSRRTILAAAPAAAIAGGAILPNAALARGADPIFPAIAEHRRLESALGNLCGITDEVAARKDGRVITAADRERWVLLSSINFSLIPIPLCTAKL